MSRNTLALLLALSMTSCGAPAATPDGGSVRDAASSVDAEAPPLDGDPTDAFSIETSDGARSDSGPAADAFVVPGTFALPPVNGGLDYQLGGAYAPPSGVTIVSRDRTESPAAGLYNICYVNGFQSQPGDEDFWLVDHPDLVLRDASGDPVIDVDWGEMLLDVRTETTRAGLAAIVGDWIAGCAADGFDAVEIDNLDSYSRSGGLMTEDQAVAFMRLLSDAAHAHGMAIAQKNSAELVPRRAELGTDFVVAEECNRFSECDVYTASYGDHVLVIEYRRADFTTGCSAFPNLSMVLRDVNLTTPGDAAYVYDGC
jgi:hypothetical protein